MSKIICPSCLGNDAIACSTCNSDRVVEATQDVNGWPAHVELADMAHDLREFEGYTGRIEEYHTSQV